MFGSLYILKMKIMDMLVWFGVGGEGREGFVWFIIAFYKRFGRDIRIFL